MCWPNLSASLTANPIGKHGCSFDAATPFGRLLPSINGIALSAANIPAGRAIIHEASGVLMPPEIADLLNATQGDTVDPFAGDVVPADGDNSTATVTITASPAASVAAALSSVDASTEAAPAARAAYSGAGGLAARKFVVAAFVLPVLLVVI